MASPPGSAAAPATLPSKKDEDDEEDDDDDGQSDDDYAGEEEEAIPPLDAWDARLMMLGRLLELEAAGEEITEEGLFWWCLEEMAEEIDTDEELHRRIELIDSTIGRMVDDREVKLGRSSRPEGRVLRPRTGGGRHVACAGSGPRPEQLPRGGGGRLRGRSTSAGG